jgi:hypothetical protein
LRYGYTLDDLDRLARAAVARDVWHRSLPLADRLDITRSAMAEHLYSSAERPAPSGLFRAAWTALRRETEDDWHTHGVSRTGSVHDGDKVMPGFWKFWWDQARSTPGPEDRVIERTALRQIWGQLRPAHRRVLAAVAACDDYGLAAEALGRSRGGLVGHVSQARREFLALWHEGEQPSTPWGTDRRRDPAKTRANATMAALAQRRRQRARRAEASDGSPPAAAQRRGKPRTDLGMSGAELVRRYEAGESLAQLAAAAGASKHVVRRRLNAEGAQMRPAGTPSALSPDNEQALCRAYTRELLTVDQCAKKFKISPTTVDRILDQHRIKRRPRGIQPAKGGTKARQPPGRGATDQRP